MKKSELKEFIREEIIEILSEADQEEEKAKPEDVENQEKLNKALEKTADLKQQIDSMDEGEDAGAADINTIADEPISEDEEEPTDADLKKTDSVAKVASKLADTTKEMKTVVNQWKKAEGSEKESLLKRLKELTKIKKELEGLL